MNKRQRKKLCCPKCGNRMRKKYLRYNYTHTFENCRLCIQERIKLMREVMSEVAIKHPVLGVFMNVGGGFLWN